MGLLTPSDIQHSAAYSDLRVLQIGIRAKVIENQVKTVMSSASSAVTYTSVYTDSEPGRAFWGADDEEISEGGIPRVIVLGYDGLPIQPVAPPSPDYIPGPEDPQTPPVPQDEDEREPMFVQAHDPDYVPEPIYPEYIPLEDEHEFPAEEQPLPPVDSPPHVDYRDDIPESEQPPHKRLRLSNLGSRYEIGESSTVRPTRGRDLAGAVPEIAPVTLGEVSTRVVELAEVHKHDIQDVYALLEDVQDGRSRISQRVDRDSQRVDLLMGDRMTLQETVWMVGEEAYASREAWAHSIGLS
ncbi:hypothetical protein Tco_0308821 [Tanacetum coccineum]